MTMRQFFAFTYKVMAEEAGGRAALEKVFENWALEEKVRQMSATRSVSWDDADAIAMSLLNG